MTLIVFALLAVWAAFRGRDDDDATGGPMDDAEVQAYTP